jgi:hypothetical protein
MASASTIHIKDSFGMTLPQGYRAGDDDTRLAVYRPWSSLLVMLENIAFKIWALLAPAPQEMTFRVYWFNTGQVRVMRSKSGLGESVIRATHSDCSWSNAWPGKRLQVCPSGPIPRRRSLANHLIGSRPVGPWLDNLWPLHPSISLIWPRWFHKFETWELPIKKKQVVL